jgi:hypothetical protein
VHATSHSLPTSECRGLPPPQLRRPPRLPTLLLF